MTVYLQFKHTLLALVLSWAVFTSTPASAAILFESGTLGPTGIFADDIGGGQHRVEQSLPTLLSMG